MFTSHSNHILHVITFSPISPPVGKVASSDIEAPHAMMLVCIHNQQHLHTYICTKAVKHYSIAVDMDMESCSLSLADLAPALSSSPLADFLPRYRAILYLVGAGFLLNVA